MERVSPFAFTMYFRLTKPDLTISQVLLDVSDADGMTVDNIPAIAARRGRVVMHGVDVCKVPVLWLYEHASFLDFWLHLVFVY